MVSWVENLPLAQRIFHSEGQLLDYINSRKIMLNTGLYIPKCEESQSHKVYKIAKSHLN